MDQDRGAVYLAGADDVHQMLYRVHMVHRTMDRMSMLHRRSTGTTCWEEQVHPMRRLTQPALISGGETIKSYIFAPPTAHLLLSIYWRWPRELMHAFPSLRFCLRGPLFSTPRPSVSLAFSSVPRRSFTSTAIMSDVSVQLTAPNGHKYAQPIGLFINNEFVASKSGEKFATINPS